MKRKIWNCIQSLYLKRKKMKNNNNNNQKDDEKKNVCNEEMFERMNEYNTWMNE